MGMQIDYKGYVERLIEYSTSDVEYLLEKFKEDVEKKVRRHAGPLLMVVMNGIDAFGGILYGFRDGGQRNSRKRSLKFMECRMGIPEPLAKFLYNSVRCGVTHHGMPKVRLVYQVWTDNEWRVPAAGAFCKDKAKDRIYMNVVKLAEQYLRAVKKVKHNGSAISGLEDEFCEAEDYFPDASEGMPIRASKTKSMAYDESSASPDIDRG